MAAKVALVTGASRGAGRAIAARLAREGWAVALVARGQQDLESSVSALRADGATVVSQVADIADEEQVQSAFAAVQRELGGLDALILNAGIGINGPIERYALADWRRVLDTNLTGAFLCSRAAIPLLRARGGGHVITIGSGAGKQGYANLAAYSASKFGLIGFMQALAQEVGEEGIKASAILPGSILTEFGEKPPVRQPGRKYLLPEDVADAVLYLLSQSPQAWTQEMSLWPFR